MSVSQTSSVSTSFFYLPTTEIGLLFWLLQRKCFSKGRHDLVLDKWDGCFQVNLLPTLESTANLLLETLSSLESSSTVFSWFSSDLSVPSTSFTGVSSSRIPFLTLGYTLTLNDFIYFPENYKQIFISNPGLSLIL